MSERKTIKKHFYYDHDSQEIKKIREPQCLKRRTKVYNCDIVDLTKSANDQSDSKSSKQMRKAILDEQKKQKTAEELERLQILSDASDRQWQNSDASNSRLREIFRKDRQQRMAEKDSLKISNSSLSVSPRDIAQQGASHISKQSEFDDLASKARQAKIQKYVKRCEPAGGTNTTNIGLSILAETYGSLSSDDDQSESE